MKGAVVGERPAPTGAGAAGISSGTALVLIANSLPANHPVKPWLVLIAPSMSVVVGFVWAWLQEQIIMRTNDRRFKRFVVEAHDLLTRQLADPTLTLTPRERRRIREDLEELRSLEAARYIGKIKALAISDAQDDAAERLPEKGLPAES